MNNNQRLIAVYGTLRKNQGNDHYMRNTEFIGECETKPQYTMYSLGGYPAVTAEGDTSIKVEVYNVEDDRAMQSINRLEGFNGIKGDPRNTFYDQITIETPYGPAEMYYFKEAPRRGDIISSGDWNMR